MTDTQRRNQILRRISRIPSDKLQEIDEYISKLEHESEKKTDIASYAGAWKDLDDQVFEEFTKNLVKNRSKNRRRIDD